MATLVLTAVGSAIGGPIGGAIGALVGSRIDARLFGPGDREGPRLQELAVTTSSYGAPVPRHFGTMRAAGSIIWATDLIESSEKSGGGKGKPSTVTYSYSMSFAVALASRPILSVGKVWADGNLLRGEAGDLKVGGTFRLYNGHGDQQPDPLIAAAEGSQCPAFRGMAYCVFEDLQLADFGNRIPSLTFEIIADNGEVSLASLVDTVEQPVATARSLADLQGFSDSGGPLRSTLEAVDTVYPLACDASGASLALFDGHPEGDPVIELPEAATDLSNDSFGKVSGRASQRRADPQQVPDGLRYYDIDRDYQAGLQRAGGRARTGRNRIVDFPGALQATKARKLADEAAERAGWSQDRLSYRVAELDPAIGPGQVVAVPGRSGKWRIESWEWRENGLELELARLPYLRGAEAATDAGRSLVPRDAVSGPTILHAFELPWDGQGSADQRQLFAAASSATSGWTGATLYADRNGSLVPIGATGTQRSVTGASLAPLPASTALFVDRQAVLDVQLDAADFALVPATAEAVASGANRALLGAEVIQFCVAENLGGGHWRLSGLLRGRGGTEHLAASVQPSGTPFVLLDQKPVVLAPAEVGDSTSIAAIGIADEAAVLAPIGGLGATRRPLTPVRPQVRELGDGGLELRWTRRARGAWAWQGTVDVPLVEQAEVYEVGLGDPEQPFATWQVSQPTLTLEPATLAQLHADHPGAALWVRQIGSHDRSPAPFLSTIA
ncbi:MAG: phage tail protein [Erythrobacter sp.]|nr:phage tail protein [Erythrobacter sp.]